MVKFHKKKRIISFDLDMTLLDHRTWEIPASAMEAIRRLREDSVIVVASGRNMNEPYSVAYRDMVKPDAIIHLNGTRVEVEGGKIIFEHLMDKERLRRLLAFGEEQKLALGISVDGGDYYTCPEDVVYYDKVRWGSSERNFKDPWLLMDMPVKTLTYVGGPEGAERLERQFAEFKFPMFAGLMGADVVEQEASKANGLMRLCEYYGIAPEQTVAFGDSMNDIEIIREAAIGVAMGNAHPGLKAAADYVTADIGDDGVWKACVALGLFKEGDGK